MNIYLSTGHWMKMMATYLQKRYGGRIITTGEIYDGTFDLSGDIDILFYYNITYLRNFVSKESKPNVERFEKEFLEAGQRAKKIITWVTDANDPFDLTFGADNKKVQNVLCSDPDLFPRHFDPGRIDIESNILMPAYIQWVNENYKPVRTKFRIPGKCFAGTYRFGTVTQGLRDLGFGGKNDLLITFGSHGDKFKKDFPDIKVDLKIKYQAINYYNQYKEGVLFPDDPSKKVWQIQPRAVDHIYIEENAANTKWGNDYTEMRKITRQQIIDRAGKIDQDIDKFMRG